MPPLLALFLWVILFLALLLYDPAKESRTSLALWVPLSWMFFISSRLPSQWLGGKIGAAAQAFEEGNPLDRSIFSALILLAIGILLSRSFNWGNFFARNITLTAFLLFALVSLFWSDYPLLSLKRWIRDLGNYLMILVVLSDARPLEAVTMLLRRLSYLLVSLSVVVIKYFPLIGRGYSPWTGGVNYQGITTSKDMLAVICLVSGIFFFWDTVVRWSDRRERRTRKIIVMNVAFIAMALWVLNLADGATCRVCLLIGCVVIMAAHSRAVSRRPLPLKLLLLLSPCLCLILVFGLDIKDSIAALVGRDPTFTGRTELWQALLRIKTNPLVGTGYESFWLGPRLEQIWATFPWRPNQAHNGYLELYLNLGLVGGSLLSGFLIASYRSIWRKQFRSQTSFAALSLALWTVLPIYNITTAAFNKGELMWLTFLLTALAVPVHPAVRVASTVGSDAAAVQERVPGFPVEPIGLHR